jgi:hypothetical protein
MWLDISKTVAGIFLGAGLAFASNATWLWIKKREEHLSAGNLTLATLGLMFNDFWHYRQAAESGEAMMRLLVPTIPDWLIMKPLPIEFNESLFLDVKTIAFLLDGKKMSSFNAFNEVMNANIQFRALAGLYKNHRHFALALQEKMSTIPEANTEEPDFSPGNFDLIEKKLGFFTTAQVSSLNTNIRIHLEKDEKVYRDAIRLLEIALLEKFSRKKVRKFSLPTSESKAKPT